MCPPLAGAARGTSDGVVCVQDRGGGGAARGNALRSLCWVRPMICGRVGVDAYRGAALDSGMAADVDIEY